MAAVSAANDNRLTNGRRESRPTPPWERELTEAERAAVIDQLEEEFDLMCLGRPAAWRIEAALQQACQIGSAFA